MRKITIYEFCKKNDMEYILEEWDYKRNKNVKPENTLVGVKYKVFWKCQHGHEWEALVSHRLYGRKTRCPHCRNRVPQREHQELALARPDLLEEWDYDKNKDRNPHEIFAGTDRKVWWKCKHGHEWEAKVNKRTRTNKPTMCPECRRLGYL